jgi:hypothetical protein
VSFFTLFSQLVISGGTTYKKYLDQKKAACFAPIGFENDPM